jgi:hypothetical protein
MDEERIPNTNVIDPVSPYQQMFHGDKILRDRIDVRVRTIREKSKKHLTLADMLELNRLCPEELSEI